MTAKPEARHRLVLWLIACLVLLDGTAAGWLWQLWHVRHFGTMDRAGSIDPARRGHGAGVHTRAGSSLIHR